MRDMADEHCDLARDGVEMPTSDAPLFQDSALRCRLRLRGPGYREITECDASPRLHLQIETFAVRVMEKKIMCKMRRRKNKDNQRRLPEE